jgi:anti-sigma-K factor RskA
MMTDHDDSRLDSGAFSLDALSVEEARSFQRAAATNPDLQRESDELVETAAILGMAIDPVDPPAQLKANLMALIMQTPQLPANPDVQESTLDSGAATESVRPSAAIRKAHSRWFVRPAVYLISAAAAVALFVGGGFAGAVVTGTSTAVDTQARGVAQISAAPDATMARTAAAGGGSATLMWSKSLGQSAVLVSGLPALTSGSVYEAWYINGTTVVSAGVLESHDSTMSWCVLKGVMKDGATIGVTVEPTGGSAQPTTDPIIAMATA